MDTTFFTQLLAEKDARCRELFDAQFSARQQLENFTTELERTRGERRAIAQLLEQSQANDAKAKEAEATDAMRERQERTEGSAVNGTVRPAEAPHDHSFKSAKK